MEPQGSRYEYSKDGKAWQESPLFEGLEPNTAYILYAREQETATHEAGEAVSGRFVTLRTEVAVYHVIQNVDGTFLEPSAGSYDELAEMTYKIPEVTMDAGEADPVKVKASGYSIGSFESDKEK